MPAPHLSHEILCVGTHDQHDFHASNARGVHDLFTGGLGPARTLATNLSGSRVAVAAVESALDAAVDRAAQNLVFFFSGHGGPKGLRVTNGTIQPEMLERRLARTSAQSILLILELAIGADPDQALLPDWLRSLPSCRDGVRVAVARATRIGAGAENEGLGRFTAGLISSLESAPGDVRFDQARYISDKLAMEQTRAHLTDRWGLDNFPLELGRLGDMPLCRSQFATQIGTGAITSITPGKGLSVLVNWSLEGRSNMRTTLRYQVVRQDGTPLCEASTVLVPANPLQKGKTRLRFLKNALRSKLITPSRIFWNVKLVDGRGRVFAEESVEHPLAG